ncbi:4-diphosphocytidyl-2-C-methyl-D-erythritol kinase [Hymenobacter roseosalivarius DSM 11622]|uniref:4-diphosphocytidyl-2-C-methyl-D-erythritol kinase n=1 Tax=Hymenobacter roseosalivarius DSM 11622 TaxID=645990 RepID=A0A1W1V736_9BACT|nr:4-(cytidine 5'-diphospho)-2-C-methyl-D-erythritol kinase [Hymenobacter roseosalivarius]SMB89086.1 4-diphosphocytidyl-2-C-methyl-D-erythritol kinase [Hymenobacter roseosalivarius DSM 11622]
MLVFPNAKLNLGLYITGLRPDGFRNLESVFVPLPWSDALEVLPATSGSLSLTGIPIPGEPSTNLCWRAYELLRADFDLPPVQMHLHKVVPIGAGLGGGSADAAFALRALNDLFDLNLPPETLEGYARRLGSDCAFFIQNTPVFAHEKGDAFTPITLNLTGTACKVIYPNLHISTAEAYARVVPRPPRHDLRASLAQPMKAWRDTVSNNFEDALTPHYPVLGELKGALYAAGAVYASLSGSGSAVYGLFPGQEMPPSLPAATDYLVWSGVL